MTNVPRRSSGHSTGIVLENAGVMRSTPESQCEADWDAGRLEHRAGGNSERLELNGWEGGWNPTSRHAGLIHAVRHHRCDVSEQVINIQLRFQQFLHFGSAEAGSGRSFL